MMKKRRVNSTVFRKISVVLLLLCFCLTLSSCAELFCTHQFELQSTTPATCVAQGEETYVCTICGEVEIRTLDTVAHDMSGAPIEHVPATCTSTGYKVCACQTCGEQERVELSMIPHIPGAPATISSQQICTACGEVIQERLDYTTYYGEELPINYHYGTGEGYLRTTVDSRYHGTYDRTIEYRDKNGNNLPLSFSVPIQEFYSHDLHSTAAVSTVDGRNYQTAGGFRVSYTFRTLSKRPDELYAWENGLREAFAAAGGGDRLILIVGSYPVAQSSSYYNNVYEIVDFTNSYIEISKKTEEGYVPLRRVSAAEDWLVALNGSELTLSADNASPFMESGVYRVLFKYDMLWVTDSSSPVYDADGVYACPYGWINSQYESFYVTVSDEKGSVLIPYESDAAETGCTFQMRAETVTKDQKFLPSYSVLEFGNESLMKISARLDLAEGVLHLDEKRVDAFSLRVSVYNEETGDYRFVEEHDLTALPDVGEIVGGGEISVPISRGEEQRGKIHKLELTLSVGGSTERAEYYYLIKW